MIIDQKQSRYQRQLVMPSLGTAGQLALAQASILCVGAGGLGSSLLYALAGAGVGRINIVDADTVALSNLNRQFLYQQNDSGEQKATVAANRLRLLNADISIAAYNTNINHANARNLLHGNDYIIDCADNRQTSLLLNDWCYHLNKPFIFASISQYSGMLASFHPDSQPCLRCWYSLLPETGQDCAVDGILGSVTSIFGALQANEVIKRITQGKQATTNTLLLFDTFTNNSQYLHIKKRNNCPACTHHQQPEDDGIEVTAETARLENWRMIDIREERDDALPNSLHLSSDAVLDFEQRWQDDTLLIICNRGIRSRILAQQLRRKHIAAYSLAGGSQGQHFTALKSSISSTS